VAPVFAIIKSTGLSIIDSFVIVVIVFVVGGVVVDGIVRLARPTQAQHMEEEELNVKIKPFARCVSSGLD